jgi:copper chaperone CopZ
MTPATLHLSVQGMTCAGCVRSVQRKLEATPGVQKAAVNLEAASATVEYDTDAVNPDALAAAVRSIGFEASAQ